MNLMYLIHFPSQKFAFVIGLVIPDAVFLHPPLAVLKLLQNVFQQQHLPA